MFRLIRDGILHDRGHGIGISRTYNSLAEVHDGDTGDQWQMSTTRRVFALTGSLNTAGSTIEQQSGDGSVVTYAYGSRNGAAAYWSTDGSGSHDRIVEDGQYFSWIDGDTQARENYEASATNNGEYRISILRDRDDDRIYYDYVGGSDLISRMRTWTDANEVRSGKSVTIGVAIYLPPSKRNLTIPRRANAVLNVFFTWNTAKIMIR